MSYGSSEEKRWKIKSSFAGYVENNYILLMRLD